MNDKLKSEFIYVISFFLFVGFVGWDIARENVVKAQETDSNEPEATEVVEVSPTPTITPSPTPTFPTERHAYVYEVFGDDYDKALLVLQGVKDINGKQICGGENYNLRPEAVNVNHHPDGTTSRDYSIFQVNDRFHPVYELNLDTDWKANVRYAFRMFKADGYTFSERWTAGKCLKDHGYEI